MIRNVTLKWHNFRLASSHRLSSVVSNYSNSMKHSYGVQLYTRSGAHALTDS